MLAGTPTVLRLFVVFLSLSRRISGNYHKLRYFFLTHLSNLLFTKHRVLERDIHYHLCISTSFPCIDYMLNLDKFRPYQTIFMGFTILAGNFTIYIYYIKVLKDLCHKYFIHIYNIILCYYYHFLPHTHFIIDFGLLS
jgi:hypothetical protein